MNFHNATLDNGLTVVAELNPSAHSLALGFFVSTGARDETAEVAGVSHFLEHMAFKGNDRYSADDVNRIFDEIGARYNASTGEEVTLYYGTILPEYLPITLEMLATLIHPALRQDDFDMEKKVILEEINMYKDRPAWVAYETVMQAYFGSHPLGRSILGTTQSIAGLTVEQMRRYHNDRYRAGNVVLAVAGNAEWDGLLALVREHCGHWPAGGSGRTVEECRPQDARIVLPREGTVQEQIAQMAPAPPADSPQRFAAELLSVIVGDYAGSRLYWELVDPGHVESADLSYNEYHGAGAWMTFLTTPPESAAQNLDRIGDIYESVNRDGATETELAQAKNKVASRIVLRAERPRGRLSSLGSNWVYRREYRSVQDDLNTLQSITTRDIRELLDTWPLAQTTTAAIGPLAALNGQS